MPDGVRDGCELNSIYACVYELWGTTLQGRNEVFHLRNACDYGEEQARDQYGARANWGDDSILHVHRIDDCVAVYRRRSIVL